MSEKPDWSRIEQDIEAALLPLSVERYLEGQEILRRLAGIAESKRILDLAQIELGHAAARAAAAIDGFTRAWNSGPAWN